jgi:hypothetical protein
MKKLLLVLVVVGAGAFLVHRYVLASPEQRACSKMASLCGMKGEEVNRCESDLTEMSKALGSDVRGQAAKCVADAKTCAEAMGCYTGAGLSGLGKALDQFFQGLGKGLQK